MNRYFHIFYLESLKEEGQNRKIDRFLQIMSTASRKSRCLTNDLNQKCGSAVVENKYVVESDVMLANFGCP